VGIGRMLFVEIKRALRREFQVSANIPFQNVKMLKINHKEPLNHVFHDVTEIAFSYQQNAKNDLTRSYVPWHHGFHDSA